MSSCILLPVPGLCAQLWDIRALLSSLQDPQPSSAPRGTAQAAQAARTPCVCLDNWVRAHRADKPTEHSQPPMDRQKLAPRCCGYQQHSHLWHCLMGLGFLMSLTRGRGRHLLHKERLPSCSWNFSCTKHVHSVIALKITVLFPNCREAEDQSTIRALRKPAQSSQGMSDTLEGFAHCFFPQEPL